MRSTVENVPHWSRCATLTIDGGGAAGTSRAAESAHPSARYDIDMTTNGDTHEPIPVLLFSDFV